MFNPGDKVTYDKGIKKEQGIVHSLSNDDHCFVVYHWGDDSSNYRDCVAVRTYNKYLKKGWLQ